MERPSDPRLQPFLRSLELIEDAIADLRAAIEILDTSIARTRDLLAAGLDPFELLAAPGTTSRDTTIEALNAMHSALMVSRGEWYRILIEDRGMSLSEIARHTGHPRQLIKRRYDALNKKLTQHSDSDTPRPNATPDDAYCRSALAWKSGDAFTVSLYDARRAAPRLPIDRVLFDLGRVQSRPSGGRR